MIDFHIEITEQMPPATAAAYAKSMGLRAFALFFNGGHISVLTQNAEEHFCAENICKSSPHLAFLKAEQQHIRDLAVYYDVQIFFGIKLQHIPPALLEQTIAFYRRIGFPLIGVHGESICDIVEQGTNFSAVLAKADILFNPGLIDEKCVEIAAENKVFLEISTHPKHAYANAHIAALAKKYNAKLVMGSQARTLEEIHSPQMQQAVMKGACIEQEHGYELLMRIQKF